MSRLALLALAGLLSLRSTLAGPIEVTAKSVGVVVADDATGTGFLVAKPDLVATNFHVVDGATSLDVRLPDEEPIRVIGFVWANAETDLVLLKLESPAKAKALVLAEDRVDLGTDVFALGAPRGLQGTVSKGVVSGYRKWLDLQPMLRESWGTFGYREDSLWIQTDAAINHGNSGGPIILGDGSVLGVCTLSSPAELAQSLNFAVAANHLREAIDGLPPSPAVHPLANLPPARRVRAALAIGAGDAAATAAYWAKMHKLLRKLRVDVGSKPADPEGSSLEALRRYRKEIEREAALDRRLPVIDPSSRRRREAENDARRWMAAGKYSDQLRLTAEAMAEAARELKAIERKGVDESLVRLGEETAAGYGIQSDLLFRLAPLERKEMLDNLTATDGRDLLQARQLVEACNDGIVTTRNLASEQVRERLQQHYGIELPSISILAFDSVDRLRLTEDKANRLWKGYLNSTTPRSKREILERILEEYPDTEAARRAKPEFVEMLKNAR